MDGSSMKSDRHIVIITPGFPKNEKDESCVPYLQAFVKYLIQHNAEYKLSIITLQYPHHETEYSWNNAAVYGCGGHDRKFPGRILTWHKCLKFFRRVNTLKRVWVIHSFWLNECAFLGNYLSKKYDTKHLCTLMGQDVKRPNVYFKLLPLSHMNLIAVSDFQKQILLEQTGVISSAVIQWGLDPSDFERSISLSPDVDILGVGSLLPVKNYSLFVDLISTIQKEHPSVKVVLVGDGPERGMLIERIKSLGLENSVKLTGTLPRRAVLDLMLRSKILLHTSLFESYGYVFSEALAAGMNIVSFKVGVAHPTEAWRVCHSFEEMAEQLKSILCKKFIRNLQVRNSVAETTNKYIKLYNSLDTNV
jgi:glycosyltransferase involved in cell wall biosynthesis